MKEYFLACGYPKNTHRKRNKKGQIHTSTRTPQNKAEDKWGYSYLCIHPQPQQPQSVATNQQHTRCSQNQPKMEKVLQNTTVINSKRQPHNLKRILTRAKCSTNHMHKVGSFKCNDKRCGTCQNIEETISIKITATGEIFQIRKPMNCKSKNVLYIITCKNCKAQYTGKNQYNSRQTHHRASLSNQK